MTLSARFSTLRDALRPARDSTIWAPHPLVRAFRRPTVYWSVVGALTLFTVWMVNDLTSAAQATLNSYGERDRVLVVTAPIAPGQQLDESVAELREVPAALVPEGAVAAMPVEPVARVALFPGEVVVSARLAGGGSGIASLVPEGSAGMTIPIGAALPPVVVGDLVDVIATFATAPDGSDEPSFAVARQASVIHVGEVGVTVAVVAEDAARVAFALTHGMITLAITG